MSESTESKKGDRCGQGNGNRRSEVRRGLKGMKRHGGWKEAAEVCRSGPGHVGEGSGEDCTKDEP